MTYYLFGDPPLKDDLSKVVSIDTETTGLKWTDSLIGLSLAWHSRDGNVKSCYLSAVPGLFYEYEYSNEETDELIRFLFTDKAVVGHYFSFDARVLFRSFGMTPNRSYDTWHMSRSLGWRQSYSLANLIADLKVQDPEWFAGKSKRKKLGDMPPSSVAPYARKDAVYALMLFDELYTDYKATGLEQQDLEFSALVYRMMARGFPLNEQLLEQRIHQEGQEFMLLQQTLASSGIANVNAPAKVIAVLNGLGIPVTSAAQEQLEPYSHIPLVQNVINAAQLSSNISSRLLVFRSYNANGLVHAEWHPYGTVSYRMKCNDPNLMAQPLKDREKRVYRPLAEIFVPPGTCLVQLDIAQAEVRLAAMIAKANSLAVFLASGSDAYMDMAQKAYGVANKETRQKAKRATLASIYEEGPDAFSLKHHVAYDEAVNILAQFKKAFPEIKAMSRNYMDFAKQYGYINLYNGRRIYFDPADNRLYRAFNQEVQGGLAQLMQTFMLNMEQAFPNMMIGQIHDSVALRMEEREATKKTLEEISRRSLQILVDSLPEQVYNLTSPRIPLKLDLETFVETKEMS